ncbi:mavicyanin [Eutrema salsugineum]|uniref:mavicyanin n=1 Tax=Eutrema salsugineum TaxID=72664 RepID=UPI000CED0C35|nr:mavicyanin [Eutrema salsugineum]
MALIKNKSFFTCLMILVALLGVVVGGTVHKVGDSKGWTMMGVDYEAWASSRTFQVGDSLVFEYNNEYHDVTQVTPLDFELCEPSYPLAKYQTGSDMVKLTKPGVHNFICGVPGHCDAGQKLQIHVLPASLGPVAAPVPRPVRSPSSISSSSSPSPANAPQYQHQIAPSPLQSGATKLASWIGFSLLALFLAF